MVFVSFFLSFYDNRYTDYGLFNQYIYSNPHFMMKTSLNQPKSHNYINHFIVEVASEKCSALSLKFGHKFIMDGMFPD